MITSYLLTTTRAALTSFVQLRKKNRVALLTAAQGILYLSQYAHKVTVLIRVERPTWSKYLDVAIRTNDKVELLFHTDLAEIHGDDQIQVVVVGNNQTGKQDTRAAGAVFVFFGEKPQSDFVAGLTSCTGSGHVLTGLDLVEHGKPHTGWPLSRDPLLLETSVPGIFAAGDVRNGTKHGVPPPSAMATRPSLCSGSIWARFDRAFPSHLFNLAEP